MIWFEPQLSTYWSIIFGQNSVIQAILFWVALESEKCTPYSKHHYTWLKCLIYLLDLKQCQVILGDFCSRHKVRSKQIQFLKSKLKVSKSRKQFFQKTNDTILSIFSTQNSEFGSFFGMIEETIICFWDWPFVRWLISLILMMSVSKRI